MVEEESRTVRKGEEVVSAGLESNVECVLLSSRLEHSAWMLLQHRSDTKLTDQSAHVEAPELVKSLVELWKPLAAQVDRVEFGLLSCVVAELE